MDPTLIGALDRRDVRAAVGWIETESDAARVLAMYHGALRHAYWSIKDLGCVVALGDAAFAYSTDVTDPQLLGLVKAIAYDVGSFCWSGWDEPGITITSERAAAGARAAERNLELAVRLERSDEVLAMAHWLVGAHELASGERDRAVASFERSAAHARACGELGAELLADGYAAVARREAPDLGAFAGVEDGDDYASQLRTTARVFNA